MMSVKRLLVAAVAIGSLAGVANVAGAQEATGSGAGPRASAARFAPPLAPRFAVQPLPSLVSNPTVAESNPFVPKRADTQRSRTLMIVGGALLLGGAIIGDDAGSLVMLGGLGVGVYGLYLHLQ